MIRESARQRRLGKLRFLLLFTTACTVFGAGCTPEQADGIAPTLAGDLARQLAAWLLL